MSRSATPWWRNRRAIASLAAGAVLILGGWGWRDLVVTRSTEATTRTELRATRTEVRTRTDDLRDALDSLTAVEGSLSASTAERDQLLEDGRLVAGQLAAARDSLVEAALNLNQRTAAAVELRACLDGISAGLNALSVGDSRTALARVRAVAGACEVGA